MLFGALHGVAEASRLRRRKCRPASRLRRHLREARHNCNRLQANVVSVAGGKTAPLSQRPKGTTKPHGGERNLAVGYVRVDVRGLHARCALHPRLNFSCFDTARSDMPVD